MRWLATCVCLLAVAIASTLSQSNIALPTPKTQADMEKFVGCPLSGSYAPNTRIGNLNLLKNRFGIPKTFDKSVTLSNMVAPGDDRHRWGQASQIPVRITGYVAFMIQNFEGESCNCFKHDDAHSDTHIDLVLDPKDASDFSKHVIVEVTPRMKYLAKQRALNWSSSSLARQFSEHWVTVEGWLFWDEGHSQQAQNTHPHDPTHMNWRATCWEVHPVTNIVLAKGPDG